MVPLAVESLGVSDVMTKRVVSVEAADKAYVAVLKMINMDIGSVVVRRGNVVAGIITKGDILRNIVKAGLDPRKASVADVMSKHIITVPSSSSVEFASRLMTKYTVSKLPVTSGGELVGIITSSDIIRAVPARAEYLQELAKARVSSRKRGLR